jgi:hypothetical protein
MEGKRETRTYDFKSSIKVGVENWIYCQLTSPPDKGGIG